MMSQPSEPLTSGMPLPRRDLELVRTSVGDWWSQLAGQAIFLTGGTGFFGAWLLESLLHANEALGLGVQITMLTRNPSAFRTRAPHIARRPEMTVLEGDVTDFRFPAKKHRFVIHAAGDSRPIADSRMAREVVDTTILGTRRVLQFAAAAGAKKFLFVSSGAVYGRLSPEPNLTSEESIGTLDPLALSSGYGEAKRVAEYLCVRAGETDGFETCIARCFAFVGPHLPLDGRYAIGNFIRDALRCHPISVSGDGTAVRSYLYAADLAIWLWILLVGGKNGHAYNVGSEAELKIGNLADLVAATIGRAGVRRAVNSIHSESSRYVPSTERARLELGLRQSVDLMEAVRRTAEWYAPLIKETSVSITRS